MLTIIVATTTDLTGDQPTMLLPDATGDQPTILYLDAFSLHAFSLHAFLVLGTHRAMTNVRTDLARVEARQHTLANSSPCSSESVCRELGFSVRISIIALHEDGLTVSNRSAVRNGSTV